AAPGSEDRLREQPRDDSADATRPIVLAATDPANPYGAALSWPERSDDARPARTAGARVILRNGHLIGYLNRSGEQLLTFLPDDEPQRSKVQAAIIDAIAGLGSDRSP